MSIAWRIEPVGNDAYRFLNFSGHQARELTIENLSTSEPIYCRTN